VLSGWGMQPHVNEGNGTNPYCWAQFASSSSVASAACAFDLETRAGTFAGTLAGPDDRVDRVLISVSVRVIRLGFSSGFLTTAAGLAVASLLPLRDPRGCREGVLSTVVVRSVAALGTAGDAAVVEGTLQLCREAGDATSPLVDGRRRLTLPRRGDFWYFFSSSSFCFSRATIFSWARASSLCMLGADSGPLDWSCARYDSCSCSFATRQLCATVSLASSLSRVRIVLRYLKIERCSRKPLQHS
jgi:hypothetical protein